MTIDVIELLKRLLRCPSVTPDAAGTLDLIEEILASAGFDIKRLRAGDVDNLWACFGDKPIFVMAGHVDVVPAGDLSQWLSPPFDASELDGFIHGRGAVDMKSGVAAMVAAAVRAAGDGHADGLALLLTSDEEGEAEHGTKHVVSWLADNGVKIPYGLVGEPTCEKIFGDAVKIGRRGSLTARIVVKGEQAHVAYPHRGDNALQRLIKALAEIAGRWESPAAKPQEGAFPPTSWQLVRVSADGGAENVTPAIASATMNFRYSPEDDSKMLQASVGDALETAAAGRWECVWHHSARPFFTTGDSRLAKELCAVIDDVCGVCAKLTTSGGSSDGRFLRDVCEELVEFGVLNAGIHEINERVRCEDVHSLTEVYYRLIKVLLNNLDEK